MIRAVYDTFAHTCPWLKKELKATHTKKKIGRDNTGRNNLPRPNSRAVAPKSTIEMDLK